MKTVTVGTGTAPTSPRARLGSAAARHPLGLFFSLAYAFSWLAELVLFGLLDLPAGVVVPVITVGPTFAAVTMTALVEGRPGIAHLWARMRMWRVGTRWYAVALLFIPVAYLFGTLVYPGAIASFTTVPAARWIVEYAIVLILGGIIGGPLFEEPGWRGFALPRMQGRWGPLGASLALGVIWAGWHFPQFLMPEWATQNGGSDLTTVAIFVLTVISICVVMTWVFNQTGGSVFLAILVHSSVNTSQVMINQLFPAVDSDVNGLIGFGALALVLVIATRGHLGYAAPASAPRSLTGTVPLAGGT